MYGLKESEFSFLKKHLVEPLKKQGARVYIFGSRVTGRHHRFSDIDLCYLALETTPLPKSLISEINTFFEDSHFPYKIDLTNYLELAKSYLPRIDQEKIEL